MMDEIKESKHNYGEDASFRFHYIDYLVFGSMLVFSAGVGVYFGYCK